MDLSDDTTGDDALSRSAPPPDDPRASANALIGTTIAGRYELVGLLGVGALGRVFRARTASGEELALKLLHDRHAGDAHVQTRFAREIEAARSIEHPNVVQVHEAGVDEQGRSFVCMELVAGGSLSEVLRADDVTPRRIESLLCDVLSALSAAHKRGIVHRDLKPDNILISRDAEGREIAKLCDFGVAKILRQETSQALTLEGMVFGTPEYMAPEQASGKNLDGRVDVYSVGVVLYQMLTRELPFQGKSPIATLSMHATDTLVSPRDRNPTRSVPRELEAVCVKALQKSPTKRFQTAIEMSEALREAVKKLDGRADVPIGSMTFTQSLTQISTSAAPERLTVEGAQVRSRTRGVIGAILLLASLAIAVPLLTRGERKAAVPSQPEAPVTAGFDLPPPIKPPKAASPGEAALSEGKRRLRQNDLAGAVNMLQRAQDELGDTPEVLRSLGEAQIKNGDARNGKATLQRYLTVSPEARDRAVVEALMKGAE